MEILVPIGLLATLVLVGVLWSRPSWLRVLAGVGTTGRPERGADALPAAPGVPGDLFTRPFVRRRLDILGAELERLERDPDIFARAFRTNVARSAYEALLVDASRLAAVPHLDLDLDPDFDFRFDLGLDLGGAATPSRSQEVLER